MHSPKGILFGPSNCLISIASRRANVIFSFFPCLNQMRIRKELLKDITSDEYYEYVAEMTLYYKDARFFFFSSLPVVISV